MFFTIHHAKRLGKTLKLPRLSILNVSVSSQSQRHGSRVSSRSRLRRSRAHPCCVVLASNSIVLLLVQLSDTGLSKYVIRTQPNNSCLSTVETVALAISLLENRPEVYQVTHLFSLLLACSSDGSIVFVFITKFFFLLTHELLHFA